MRDENNRGRGIIKNAPSPIVKEHGNEKGNKIFINPFFGSLYGIH